MNTSSLPGAPGKEGLPGVVGPSALLAAAVERARIIAASEAPCLLMGETGTGKELFARAIHYCSARSDQPFVPVNCGAIADSLFENELFGHVRGAYTDAAGPNVGLLAYAEHGTLFLDEVDALSASAQVKLLRVLQEGEYRPVGSPKLVHSHCRVLAAANCDLGERIDSRRFREDLFHRLNVLRLTVPSLRERVEDIPVLARHFAKEFAERYQRPTPALDPGAIERLVAHHWPGNVRELQGVIQRAVLMARGSALQASDLDLPDGPAPPFGGGHPLAVAKSLAIERFERSYLSDVLQRCDGNISRAARESGKERRSFQRLLRKHRIAATHGR